MDGVVSVLILETGMQEPIGQGNMHKAVGLCLREREGEGGIMVG